MGNQATALRPDVISDLQESTAFTAEEIRQYYKTFKKEDSSGDMALSITEFKQVYAKIFPDGDADKFAEHVFRSFDLDKDGNIDFREFLTSLSIQKKGSVEQRLEWTFKLYDLDGSGQINKDELTKMIKSIYSLKGKGQPVTPDEMADHIIKRADTDKDGQLSMKEFVKGAMESATLRTLLVGTLEAANVPKGGNTSASKK